MTLLKKGASALAGAALLMSSMAMVLPFAHAQTAGDLNQQYPSMAEQIICYVDQQLGSSVPFDPQINYCGDSTPDPAQCMDAVDNDHDGIVDMADPDCDSASDNTESGSMGTTTPTVQCMDGMDNDSDGVVDMADPDCDSMSDNTESGTMGTTTGTTTPMQCADTLDNDSDGVIDLVDPDCTNAQDNTESGSMGTTTGTTTPMQCADTLDNDADGIIDLSDPDCANASDNTESGSMGSSTGTTTDAALHVDSVDAIDTTATADDSYSDGWQFVFHITTPNNEENLSMRFSDWMSSQNASTTFGAANNIRISSQQASSTAPITITAANAYSTPALVLTSDLNAGQAGRQVDVLVEVKVPNGTPNETFSTTYGVQTLP